MGKNVTARPGRYRVATAPYQRKPQEAFTDPAVQTVVLYWAKRLGKTEMINNLHGSQMEQNPRNILHVLPTLDSAKKWSKQFLMPMVRSTKVLKNLIRDARKKEITNTILAKEFPGGTIAAIGANSPSGFRQVQAPVVTCDEVDAMENGPEGDPVINAFGRAENYSDCIQVVSSTATRIIPPAPGEPEGVSTGSRIHDWWLKSDQEKWFVPCGKCGEWHVLAWSQIKWPKDHRHEESIYECPICANTWNDRNRIDSIMAGDWRATAPFRGVAGFWLNGLNSLFPAKKGFQSKLHQFAAEFYQAYTSGEDARAAWQMTFLCEPVELKVTQTNPSDLEKRAELTYRPDSIPDSIALVCGGADVQEDRVEIEWIGLGEKGESWGIEVVKIHGDTKKDETWQRVGTELTRPFKRKDGVELHAAALAIDFHFLPDQVKAFSLRHGTRCKVCCVIGVGSGNKQVSLVQERQQKEGRFAGLQYWTINPDPIKDVLYQQLSITEKGPRYMHFPLGFGYTDKWFKQLTVERAVTRFKHGFPTRVYEKPDWARNEAMDCRVYWYALIEILRPNIPQMLANLKPKQNPAPSHSRHPQFGGRKGWVTGWRQ